MAAPGKAAARSARREVAGAEGVGVHQEAACRGAALEAHWEGLLVPIRGGAPQQRLPALQLEGVLQGVQGCPRHLEPQQLGEGPLDARPGGHIPGIIVPLALVHVPGDLLHAHCQEPALHGRKEAQAYPEDRLPAHQEKDVIHVREEVRLDAVGKERQDTLMRKDIQREALFLEVPPEAREVRADHSRELEDAQGQQRDPWSKDVLEVVAFYQREEHPEGIPRSANVDEKRRGHEVHALAVSDLRLGRSHGPEHLQQLRSACLTRLAPEARVLGESPVHVALNLGHLASGEWPGSKYLEALDTVQGSLCGLLLRKARTPARLQVAEARQVPP
mmetsp:Transcript_43714/g.126242  ORF Transcript_43714/g.126242 Transcript_43714/m.126242 type:complete len:332 (-) Transcript_43714:255-1250(-)